MPHLTGRQLERDRAAEALLRELARFLRRGLSPLAEPPNDRRAHGERDFFFVFIIEADRYDRVHVLKTIIIV